MQQSGVDVTAALEDLPTYSEAEAEKIEEEEAEEDLRLSQKEHDDNLWKREPLSEECMSLLMLGEPEGYDSFQQLLSFGRLSSSLRSVQDALHLPVRLHFSCTITPCHAIAPCSHRAITFAGRCRRQLTACLKWCTC